VVGTFSGSPLAVPGMFQMIQWVWSSVVLFLATSGSCIYKKKVWVLAGVLAQSSLGETTLSPATWVYLWGISVPSANAELVSVKGGPAGPLWAKAQPADKIIAIPLKVNALRIIGVFSPLDRIPYTLNAQEPLRELLRLGGGAG